MPEEKELKSEGESLAKIAVESKMGKKQLKTLYDIARTKPLEYLDAFVKRQLSRTIEGTLDGGEAFFYIENLLKKYEGQRMAIQKVMMYALMLYDYYEKEPAIKLLPIAEPVIKREVEMQGHSYGGAEVRVDQNVISFNVRVPGFSGNPKILAYDIVGALKKKEEFSDLNVRVWISK